MGHWAWTFWNRQQTEMVLGRLPQFLDDTVLKTGETGGSS